MIIDDKHRFVFVHIPKCAGTSVRSVLSHLDTSGGMFSPHVVKHPVLGTIDMTHLPLAVLRQYFPEAYQKVQQYHSVAVLRDPYRRFPSSIYQHQLMYGDKPPRDQGKGELKKRVEEVITFLILHENDECLPHHYIHFQRQYSYVYDQGERLISSLFTTHSIPALLAHISELVGEDLTKSQSDANPHLGQAIMFRSEFMRRAITAVRPILAKPAHMLLSEKMVQRLWRFLYVPQSRRNRDIFDSEYVRDFIRSYYQSDLCLYSEQVDGNG